MNENPLTKGTFFEPYLTARFYLKLLRFLTFICVGRLCIPSHATSRAKQSPFRNSIKIWKVFIAENLN